MSAYKIRQFVKDELSGWKTWEISWLILACSIITGLSIYWQDNVLGIVSALTGVICVVCTGKGKLSAYTFGLVNSALYAIISFQATYYGETMLNALYYVPMQFVGFYIWNKNIDQNTKEVHKRHMSWSGRFSLALAIAVGTATYGIALKYMGDAMPFVDAFTTISSVFAMIISVRMFAEQWWIWVAVDVVTIYMWYQNFVSGNDNIATLLMWVVYLVNAIIMLVKWERESRAVNLK